MKQILTNGYYNYNYKYNNNNNINITNKKINKRSRNNNKITAIKNIEQNKNKTIKRK
ncbi:hypothetical protein C530_199 [Candidatus Portiera aleyrodidarum BT-B-HRs]|nr:hypothetical protein C530_199 [Candidatus Portiera aleyrodidarum BT-B-HRs]